MEITVMCMITNVMKKIAPCADEFSKDALGVRISPKTLRITF